MFLFDEFCLSFSLGYCLIAKFYQICVRTGLQSKVLPGMEKTYTSLYQSRERPFVFFSIK